MTDDTPTTEDVRHGYAWSEGGVYHEWDMAAYPKFDRWLAGVKADTLRDYRHHLVAWQKETYAVVLPDVREIVGDLDNEADRIEGEA